MSHPHEPLPAKLVCSILAASGDAHWAEVVAALETRFGPMELAYPAMPFSHTTYYDRELGSPLTRRMVAFARVLPQNALCRVKRFTNALENRLSGPDGRRRVNLDPGFLTMERFVLATGKNYTHRIYLGRGIFGDLTLVFQAGSWQTLPWTFPDYAAPNMLHVLTDIRRRYHRDLREAASNPITDNEESPCPKA
jgi:hypothetical protein